MDLRVAGEMPLPSSSHSTLVGPCFCPPLKYVNVITQLLPPGDVSFLCGMKDPNLIPHWVTLAQGLPNSRGPRNVCEMSWGGQGPPCHREWVKVVLEQLRVQKRP